MIYQVVEKNSTSKRNKEVFWFLIPLRMSCCSGSRDDRMSREFEIITDPDPLRICFEGLFQRVYAF